MIITIASLLIALLYYRLGKKMGKNPIAWAFVGIGVSITIPILFCFLIKFMSPATALFVWAMSVLAGWLLAIAIALYIANRHKIAMRILFIN